jgi:hypothetical protein
MSSKAAGSSPTLAMVGGSAQAPLGASAEAARARTINGRFMVLLPDAGLATPFSAESRP